jgi:hypothetical protein
MRPCGHSPTRGSKQLACNLRAEALQNLWDKQTSYPTKMVEFQEIL